VDEERYLILKMLEEGKITAEQAAALLAALEGEDSEGGAGSETGKGAGEDGGEGSAGGSGEGSGEGPEETDEEGGGMGPACPRWSGRGWRRHSRDRWFDQQELQRFREEMRRELEKLRLGAMDIGDEVSRRVQDVLREQRELWRRGGPRSFRHLVRHMGDVFNVPLGREMYEEHLEKEVAVDPDVRVRVRNLSGDVKVMVHDSATVKVLAVKRVWAATADEARRRAADYEVKVEGGGREVRIGAELADDAPGWLPARCTIDYDILVPAGAQVSAGLTNGDLSVTGVRGGLEARSTHGDVAVEGVSGPLTVSTVNGDIVVTSAEPADLSLRSVNGDVRLELLSLGAGRHSVGTTRGDITAAVPAGASLSFSASTMHGDIELELPCTVISRSATSLEGRVGTGIEVPELELRALSGDIVVQARKEK